VTDLRVMIVVGMHRTGTSAITRGLTAIGVELGDDLLPPNVDNPKGFWENRAIVDLDERLLTSLGHSWSSHGVCAVAPSVLVQDHSLFFEAVQLIRASTSRYPLWGFKDPRSARLLPFWQAICQHSRCLRAMSLRCGNPLSVADLLQRGRLSPRKGPCSGLNITCAHSSIRRVVPSS
jgi:hypothetical protein